MLRTRVSLLLSLKRGFSLKSMWTELVNKPRLVDQSGELAFNEAFWKKNVAISTAVSAVSASRGKKAENRVCILTENNREFLSGLLSTWISGKSAVPLSSAHPLPQLQYYLEDSHAQVIIADRKNRELAWKLQAATARTKPGIVISEECPPASAKEFFLENAGQLFTIGENSEGLILYTSGTTGRPKGVSLSLKSVATQIQAQAKAWEWTSSDVVLHMLPLYHTHGLVNAFLSPLFHGATVVMKPRFSEEEVVKYLSGELKTQRGPVTAFTGVPTMYAKLLDFITQRKYPDVKSRFHNIRLLMSGSAPLSQTLAKSWTETTGIQLLERYGCTETGMVLTNPLKGQRNVGYVGMPFDTVVVRLVHSQNGKVILVADVNGVKSMLPDEKDDFAELQVSGPSIFTRYINREKETAEAITVDEDGTRWYKTGDCVSYSSSLNSFKINGRASADIIKSGGFKISALDVETKLSEHPNIKECAVVGIADAKWGERVALIVQLKDRSRGDFTLDELKVWCKSQMPHYWTPTEMIVIDDTIPRNNMGKINKKELRKIFFPSK